MRLLFTSQTPLCCNIKAFIFIQFSHGLPLTWGWCLCRLGSYLGHCSWFKDTSPVSLYSLNCCTTCANVSFLTRIFVYWFTFCIWVHVVLCLALHVRVQGPILLNWSVWRLMTQRDGISSIIFCCFVGTSFNWPYVSEICSAWKRCSIRNQRVKL